VKGAAAALAALCGCSFATVHGPGDTPPHRLDCTESSDWIVGDGIVGGTFAMLGTVVVLDPPTIGGSDRVGSPGTSLRALALPLYVIAALYLTSAAYGLDMTSRCREVRRAIR